MEPQEAVRVGKPHREGEAARAYFSYGMDPQEVALMAGKLPGDPGWDADIVARPGDLFSADGTERQMPTLPGSWQTYYALLADCLHGGGAPPVDPWDAVNGLKGIEAALCSAKEGRTVDL